MAEHISAAFPPRIPRNQEDNTILNPRIPRKKTQAETEGIARKLVERFNSPQHYPFFLKAAWRLSEARIWTIVEVAFEKGTSPRAYFIGAVKNEKSYKG